jgi:hypothetical protein
MLTRRQSWCSLYLPPLALLRRDPAWLSDPQSSLRTQVQLPPGSSCSPAHATSSAPVLLLSIIIRKCTPVRTQLLFTPGISYVVLWPTLSVLILNHLRAFFPMGLIVHDMCRGIEL